MTVQQLTGEADTVLQVGERVAHVPARLGQILDFEFDRAGEEPDDRKIIARVARADETLQRQRYLLGRGETALPAHRPAHIEQQDRGAGGGMVSVKDGEVLRRQLEGDAGAAQQRLLQRTNQVEMLRIAVCVGSSFIDLDLSNAAVVRGVRAGAVA